MKVDSKRCPQNHRCPAIRQCPVDAITQQDNRLPVIDRDKCIHCMSCVLYCPMNAIRDED